MENYIDVLKANSELARIEFSSLSDEQFNFKPSPDTWSIGQCLLHLVKTNKGYFPVYDKLSDTGYSPNFFEKTGLLAGFWEKYFIEGVDPKNLKKWTAPASVVPGQSHIHNSIIDKLSEQNEKIAGYYRQLHSMGLDKAIVSSPFAKFIVYKASCSFDIVALHEQRHLQQAMRVKALLN